MVGDFVTRNTLNVQPDAAAVDKQMRDAYAAYDVDYDNNVYDVGLSFTLANGVGI